MTALKNIFDFIIFSSLFIALCATVLVYQAYFLFIAKPLNFQFQAFVFFATICSYNFHWMLSHTDINPAGTPVLFFRQKKFQRTVFICSLIPVVYYATYFLTHWYLLLIAALLTFLYSSPKISYPPFQWLKKIAFGKTIFLAIVWTYVTTILPFFIEGISINNELLIFFAGQFFFIFTLCILFDYRDRQEDIAEGIKSLVTYMDEKGIDILFSISVLISAVCFIVLSFYQVNKWHFLISLVPLVIVAPVYRYAKKNFSDYLYCFVLDGLMMLPGMLIWIMNRF